MSSSNKTANCQIDAKKEAHSTLWLLIILFGLLAIPFVMLLSDAEFAQKLEDSLAVHLGSTSIATPAITRTALATVASMFPLLIDHSMDAIFAFNAGNLERLFFVLVFVLTKYAKYEACVSGSIAHPLSVYCLSIATQLLCAWAVAFIVMHRLQPQLFSSVSGVSLILSLFTRVYSAIAYDVYGVDWMATVSMISRTLTVLFMLHCILTPLFKAFSAYRASKLSVIQWFHSLDSRYQHALLIIGACFSCLVAMMISIARFRSVTLHHFSQDFLINFDIGSMCLALVFVVIPHRLIKAQAATLQDSLNLKKQFVRYISHEIRSPLGVITSGIDLLKSDLLKETPPTLEEIFVILDAMRDCCGTGIHILNDLLTFEKLEGGLMVLEKEIQDPNVFLSECIGAFSLSARAKRVRMTVHNAVDRGSCLVCIDEGKMNQVFRNLLSNAIKFTDSDDTVSVSAAVRDNYLRVEVKDSGPGLSLENQAKLFHNVVQFHAKAQQGGGGSGFGLWISKKIADLHGGEVGVHSDGEGKSVGSTFFFTVPLVTPETVPGDEVKTLEASLGEELVDEIGDTKARILIVDDSPMNRKMLAKSLDAEGHTTYTAEDGDVAVHLVTMSLEENEPNRYEIILMDNVMVRMNGTVATKAIRALGFEGLIIGVTGNALEEDVEEFVRFGADKVMPKPFQKDIFKAYLREEYIRGEHGDLLRRNTTTTPGTSLRDSQ